MFDNCCGRNTSFYDENVKILDSINDFVNQLPTVFKAFTFIYRVWRRILHSVIFTTSFIGRSETLLVDFNSQYYFLYELPDYVSNRRSWSDYKGGGVSIYVDRL